MVSFSLEIKDLNSRLTFYITKVLFIHHLEKKKKNLWPMFVTELKLGCKILKDKIRQ